MAQYKHLEIYKKSIEFVKVYANLFAYFKREYRFTIGEKLLYEIVAFIVLIYRANDARSSKTRLTVLDEMGAKIQNIDVLIRVAQSVDCISDKKYLILITFVAEIEKQLSGWSTYTYNQMKKEEKAGL